MARFQVSYGRSAQGVSQCIVTCNDRKAVIQDRMYGPGVDVRYYQNDVMVRNFSMAAGSKVRDESEAWVQGTNETEAATADFVAHLFSE